MIWNSTGHKGIRFRKHNTRKHGIKFDRYYAIRLQRGGERIEEGLGWESEGWTLDKAISTLAKLKEAHKVGSGPTRLKEHREIAIQKKADSAKDKMTFGHIYTEKYLPHTQGNKKAETIGTEHSMFKIWISPVIGKLPLKDIAPFHLEKIKHNMKKAGRSSRRIEYCLAVVRQVFNYSFRNDLYLGVNPVKKIKLPRSDNKRQRFLTVDEADALLGALKKESAESV